MAPLFGCCPGRSRTFFYFATIAWASWSLATTLIADDVKTRRTLPRPYSSPDESRIFRALAKPTTVEFLELPLEDCLTFLKEYHNIRLRTDTAALEKAKIPLDSAVTLKLDGTPFQGTLDSLLEPLGLDSFVGGSELVVTTRAAAADAVRSRLTKTLAHELQIMDYLCELTETQKQKLELAGRGDVERLCDGIEERRMKILRNKNDEKKVNQIFREITQLKQQLESGPFGRGALFRKAMETTLTAEQAVKYKPIREVLQGGGLVDTVERGRDVVLGVVLLGEGFSDEIVVHLKRLPALGLLRVFNTKITDAGIAELQQALPALKIEK